MLYVTCFFELIAQQKIVIEVQMRSRKHRAKAMKIAAVADGIYITTPNMFDVFISIKERKNWTILFL